MVEEAALPEEGAAVQPPREAASRAAAARLPRRPEPELTLEEQPEEGGRLAPAHQDVALGEARHEHALALEAVHERAHLD